MPNAHLMVCKEAMQEGENNGDHYNVAVVWYVKRNDLAGWNVLSDFGNKGKQNIVSFIKQ